MASDQRHASLALLCPSATQKLHDSPSEDRDDQHTGENDDCPRATEPCDSLPEAEQHSPGTQGMGGEATPSRSVRAVRVASRHNNPTSQRGPPSPTYGGTRVFICSLTFRVLIPAAQPGGTSLDEYTRVKVRSER